MFFGWGKKSKRAPTHDGKEIIAVWNYVHIMFLFRTAWGVKYYLVGNDRSQDRLLSHDEAAQKTTQLPAPSAFEKFGLPVAIVSLLITFTLPLLLTSL